MAITLFENLKKLHEQELYKSAIELGEILLKSNTRNKSLLTPSEYYQALSYLGSTYYSEGEYKQAEGLFRQALAARRLLDQPVLVTGVICDENEIKFKTAKCLSSLNYSLEAVQMIETIPMKQRSAKVHYLYGQLNKDRSTNNAIAAFKEVLKENQLALDVAEQLLKLGTSGLEVNSLMVDATHWPQCDWLPNWIEAHSFLAAHNFKAAVSVFKMIESGCCVQNHYRTLVQIGKCYFYDGSYDLAMRYLERANTESPQMCGEGLILLANLLCRENRLADLERLTSSSTVTVNEYRPEHWYILALSLYFSDRYERVDYFLDKARGKSAFLDIEVSLLKANVYIAFQKSDQALVELRAILKPAGHRFELYKSFVDAYIKKNRHQDALLYASIATQTLGKTPRTLMLYAKVYEAEGDGNRVQLKAVLAKIHAMDENYLPAIYMLVEVLRSEADYTQAIRILRPQLVVQPNSRLATMMGDIYGALKEYSNAMGFYNMALRMDPTNQKALNALNNMTVEGKRGNNGGGGDNMGIGSCSSASEKMTGNENPFDVVDFGSSNVVESNSIVQNNETLWSDGEMNNN